MRIRYLYQDKEQLCEFDQAEIIIGRPNPHLPPDLDLAQDITVSRTHARLWREDGHWWIEDLASKHGTELSGVRLEGKLQVHDRDHICVGATDLYIELPEETATPEATGSTTPQASEPDLRVDTALNVEDASLLTVATLPGHTKERLALLLELPLQFALETNLDNLLQIIVKRVVILLPGAERGAILLRDSDEDLVLKAFVSPAEPPVSKTLSRRVMREGRALVWRSLIQGVESESIRRLEIQTGMYAPLLWKGASLGVICVDNPKRDCLFSEDDLRLLMAVANYAAMAVANHLLADDQPSPKP